MPSAVRVVMILSTRSSSWTTIALGTMRNTTPAKSFWLNMLFGNTRNLLEHRSADPSPPTASHSMRGYSARRASMPVAMSRIRRPGQVGRPALRRPASWRSRSWLRLSKSGHSRCSETAQPCLDSKRRAAHHLMHKGGLPCCSIYAIALRRLYRLGALCASAGIRAT